MTCEICEILNKIPILNNRVYWLITELFVEFHDGDVCKN